MAVRRYSGRWKESTYKENLQTLREALYLGGVDTTGPPILARYNSPISLPFFRRNEVMLEVEGKYASIP